MNLNVALRVTCCIPRFLRGIELTAFARQREFDPEADFEQHQQRNDSGNTDPDCFFPIHHAAVKPEIRLLVKAAILPLPTGQSTKSQDVSRSGMPCRSSH
jgi:hypothetical protein